MYNMSEIRGAALWSTGVLPQWQSAADWEWKPFSVNELGSVGGSFTLQVGLPRSSAASLTQTGLKWKIKIEQLQLYWWHSLYWDTTLCIILTFGLREKKHSWTSPSFNLHVFELCFFYHFVCLKRKLLDTKSSCLIPLTEQPTTATTQTSGPIHAACTGPLPLLM